MGWQKRQIQVFGLAFANMSTNTNICHRMTLNFCWLWIMGDFEVWVTLNYGWLWNMGELWIMGDFGVEEAWTFMYTLPPKRSPIFHIYYNIQLVVSFQTYSKTHVMSCHVMSVCLCVCMSKPKRSPIIHINTKVNYGWFSNIQNNSPVIIVCLSVCIFVCPHHKGHQ